MAHEQGICPKCGSMNLEYGSIELDDNQCGYPMECNDCGFRGMEWYSMMFIEYTDKSTGEPA